MAKTGAPKKSLMSPPRPRPYQRVHYENHVNLRVSVRASGRIQEKLRTNEGANDHTIAKLARQLAAGLIDRDLVKIEQHWNDERSEATCTGEIIVVAPADYNPTSTTAYRNEIEAEKEMIHSRAVSAILTKATRYRELIDATDTPLEIIVGARKIVDVLEGLAKDFKE